jgi:hypothetical protein
MSTNQAANQDPSQPAAGQPMTGGPDATGAGQKPKHERARRLGMKMFGPADSGPYGPPTEPPAPKPRDRWGHPVKEPKAK